MSITDDRSMGRRVGINTERKHTTPDEALGAVITELRVQKNWSHAEMGEKVGYSDKHLNAVELGYKPHSPAPGCYCPALRTPRLAAPGTRGTALLQASGKDQSRSARQIVNKRSTALISTVLHRLPQQACLLDVAHSNRFSRLGPPRPSPGFTPGGGSRTGLNSLIRRCRCAGCRQSLKGEHSRRSPTPTLVR